MERVPPPDLPSGLTLRNAAYALQWWVFALFALWMWVKMVRDDYRRHQPVRRGVAPGSPPT
jgi:surfeit locus 1 family protein